MFMGMASGTGTTNKMVAKSEMALRQYPLYHNNNGIVRAHVDALGHRLMSERSFLDHEQKFDENRKRGKAHEQQVQIFQDWTRSLEILQGTRYLLPRHDAGIAVCLKE